MEGFLKFSQTPMTGLSGLGSAQCLSQFGQTGFLVICLVPVDNALFCCFIISWGNIFQSAGGPIFVSFFHQGLKLSFQGAYARFHGAIYLLFSLRASCSFDCGFCIWHILILTKTFASIELVKLMISSGLSMLVLRKERLFPFGLFSLPHCLLSGVLWDQNALGV